jgi:hypothetical protein
VAVSAATREGLRRLDGWTVRVWLSAPSGRDGPGRWNAKSDSKIFYDDAGPVTGVIRLDVNPDVGSFLFARMSGGVCRIRFEQVSTWAEVAPPPRPPLPVEQVPR